MDFKLFVSPPVGWGSLNVLFYQEDSSYRPVIATDGGAIPSCLNHISSEVITLIKNVIYTHEPRIWVISHLDYDHVSIASQIFAETGVDFCLLPYVYCEKACRETLALFLALESLLFRIPDLLAILGVIAKICRHKVKLVDEHTNISIDDQTRYEFLWPSSQYIGHACEEIRKELQEKVKRSKIDESELYSRYEEFLAELDRLGEGDILREVDLRKLWREAKKDQSHKRLSDHLSLELSISMNVNEHADKFMSIPRQLSDHQLSKLMMETMRIRTRILNVYSIAYLIHHYGKAFHMIWDVITPPCLSLMFDHHFIECRFLELPDHLRLLEISSGIRAHAPIQILYLGDLGEDVLKAIFRSIKQRKFEIILAAHHGNSWDNNIRGKLTYVQRCSKHSPKNYVKAFRWEYCQETLCILGEHRYGLVSVLKL